MLPRPLSLANTAARDISTPAMTVIVLPRRRMPPRQSRVQITRPRRPSSGASTLVPAPRITGAIPSPRAAFRTADSSPALRGKTISSAGPPMRKEVCLASGSSSIYSIISSKEYSIFLLL